MFSSIILAIKKLFATSNDEEYEVINKHSDHIEELMLDRKYQGVVDALDGINKLVSQINNNDLDKMDVSTKIDGCVHQDTLVVTSNGPKKIKDLTNDDYVKAYNTKTNQIVWCNKTHPRITSGSKKWVKVNIKKNASIVTTFDHPFMLDDNQYIEAQYVCHHVIKCLSGQEITVQSVEHLKQKYDQWDLTTSAHNFVVLVDDCEIVIHNSPAIFLINGCDGFAVSTKSIFNKEPKVNYTIKDIKKNHSGQLQTILTSCLQNLSKVMTDEPNTIYQGDLLFYDKQIEQYQISSQPKVGFHPNTILYTFDKYTDVGKKLLDSVIGFAVHTKYTWDGKDPSTMKIIEYGCSKKNFKQNSDVFLIDTKENFNRNCIVINKQERDEISEHTKRIEQIATTIDWSILDNELVSQYIKMFVNTYIRSNTKMPSYRNLAESFHDYMVDIRCRLRADRKTYRGRKSVDDRINPIIELPADQLQLIFEIYERITKCKLIIIKKLNKISFLQKYLVSTSGMITKTDEEGFVFTGTKAIGSKLVDRYQFSANNFSEKIVHGNQHREHDYE